MYKLKATLQVSLTCAVVFLLCSIPPTTEAQQTITVTAIVNGTSTPSSGGGSGGGGGGGGGASSDASVSNQVQFKGKAYPGSQVSLLKDGALVARVPASPDANFEISLSGFSNGTYNFGVWAEDIKGERSITQTFNVTLTSGVTTVVSGIFLPPTISVDKLEVRRGDILTIIGQSVPQATVNIFVHPEEEVIKTVKASEDGSWIYKFDTLEVAYGDHITKARSSSKADISTFSQSVGFKVGYTNVATPKIAKKIKSDLNDDGRVNLIDFSILAYWYKRSTSSESLKKVDLNSNRAVDLIDFSIMAYEWTG